MTREESINKIEGLGVGLDKKGCASLINALEALGLLKFEQVKEEPAKPSATTVIKNSLVDSSNIDTFATKAYCVVNALMAAKYKIVDTEVCEIVNKRQLEASVLPICYRGYSSEHIDRLINRDKSKKQQPLKHSSEKGKYIFFPHPDGDGKDNVSVLQSDAVKTMREYGYVCVKKNGDEVVSSPRPVECNDIIRDLKLVAKDICSFGPINWNDTMRHLKQLVDNWH